MRAIIGLLAVVGLAPLAGCGTFCGDCLGCLTGSTCRDIAAIGMDDVREPSPGEAEVTVASTSTSSASSAVMAH